MNSADFFLLYLHLANRKAIKNYTLVTKLQNINRTEHVFAKETFTLLAFAGLRKTIAVSEWRNLFGYRGFDSQALNSKFSLHSTHSYGQKASKFKTLTRFKKTVNPHVVEQSAALPSGWKTQFVAISQICSQVRRLGDKIASPAHRFAGWGGNKVCDRREQTVPSFPNKAVLPATYERQRASLAQKAEKSLAYKTRLQETAKTSNKKFLNLFNQRILSQSFKKNFLLNLENCEKPLSTALWQSLQQGKSREDHQINLTSWAPILDLREFTTRSATTINGSLREQAAGKPLEKLSLDQIELSIQNAKFLPKLKTPELQPYCGISSPCFATLEQSLKKDFVETARVAYIKDYFDNTKKEILLASPNITKFYTASWLLESIRTELSSRNANIKRVLNQTFLLTQQPLFNLPKNYDAKFQKSIRQIEKQLISLKASNHEGPGRQVSDSTPADYRLQSFDSTPLIKEATVIPYLIKGLRITFSGRLGGKKGMAKTLTKTTGRVPLSTLGEKIDFAKGVVQTKTGSLGIKVWVCYN